MRITTGYYYTQFNTQLLFKSVFIDLCYTEITVHYFVPITIQEWDLGPQTQCKEFNEKNIHSACTKQRPTNTM